MDSFREPICAGLLDLKDITFNIACMEADSMAPIMMAMPRPFILGMYC